MHYILHGKVHNYYLLCSVLRRGKGVLVGFVHKMDTNCELACIGAEVVLDGSRAIWVDADFFFVAECDLIITRTRGVGPAKPGGSPQGEGTG